MMRRTLLALALLTLCSATSFSANATISHYTFGCRDVEMVKVLNNIHEHEDLIPTFMALWFKLEEWGRCRRLPKGTEGDVLNKPIDGLVLFATGDTIWFVQSTYVNLPAYFK